jgi:hypothetical protein
MELAKKTLLRLLLVAKLLLLVAAPLRAKSATGSVLGGLCFVLIPAAVSILLFSTHPCNGSSQVRPHNTKRPRRCQWLPFYKVKQAEFFTYKIRSREHASSSIAQMLTAV